MSFRIASNVGVTSNRLSEVLKLGMTDVANDSPLKTETHTMSPYRTVEIPCSNLKSKHPGMQDMASSEGVRNWLKSVPVGQWMTICNDELIALEIGQVSPDKFYSDKLKTFGLVCQIFQIPKHFSFSWDYSDQARAVYSKESDVFYMARFEKSTNVITNDDKWNVTIKLAM